MNVLLGLGWPNHMFHSIAVARLERRPKPRWATCALTQLGFVRLSCHPSFNAPPRTPSEAVAFVRALTRDPQHVFLGELPSLAGDELKPILSRVMGHQQITDAYLVALARHHRATLLTFDGRLSAMAGSDAEIEVLSAKG